MENLLTQSRRPEQPEQPAPPAVEPTKPAVPPPSAAGSGLATVYRDRYSAIIKKYNQEHPRAPIQYQKMEVSEIIDPAGLGQIKIEVFDVKGQSSKIFLYVSTTTYTDNDLLKKLLGILNTR